MALTIAYCRLCGDIKGWGGPTALVGHRCSDCLPDRVLTIIGISTGKLTTVTVTAPHLLADNDVVRVFDVNGNMKHEVSDTWLIQVVDDTSFNLVGCETMYKYGGGGKAVVVEDDNMEFVEIDGDANSLPLASERVIADIAALTINDQATRDAQAAVHARQKSLIFDGIADQVTATVAAFSDQAAKAASARGRQAPVVSALVADALDAGVKTVLKG